MEKYDIIHRIELSNGFLVCKSQEKLSVWRWAQDQQRDPVHLEPAAWQTLIYERAMRLADAPHRGELIPILAIPKPNFSLYPLIRFRYPTLCIWSEMHQPIRFWSFESRSFDRSIELNRPNTNSVMIYDRLTCDLLFQFEYDCIDIARLYSTLPSLSRGFQDRFEEYVLSHQRDPESTPRNLPAWVDRDRVLEVYSSPTGNNLVGIMRHGCIFHCPIDLENPGASKGRISFTRVQTKLWTAAYDGHKIVAYGPQGLSIIYLVNQQEPGTFPAITMYHIPVFRARYLKDHDRVEMTRDTCWLSLTPQDRADTRCIVGMVDFAQGFEGEGETAAES
ncbi:hypothetical protein RSOLAG22IIIB_13323 [Rhizoctonia solani]|uniref:Uncharacterized protein n=1 Tax=Rhizoctonia solani TaxID=456999 RepID=A0A0K6FM28_9AGAM|nr:hypothetical protein RSOLAG22IIIB_13323 [Rhizoctonia solani]